MHYLVCLLTVYQSCSKPLSEGSLPVVSIITRFKNSYFWKSPSASSVKFFIRSRKTRLSGQMCAADRCSDFLLTSTKNWESEQQVASWLPSRLSTSQTHIHSPRRDAQKQVPETNMHASHTAWLINSNLNDRSLTSYTHAFWWFLEKMSQWSSVSGKDEQSEAKAWMWK